MSISNNEGLFNTARYIKLRDAFEGDGGFNNGVYLQKFYKESTEKFSNRSELAFYDNNFETIVRAYTNPIYPRVVSKVTETENTPEELEQFCKNSSGTGQTLREQFTSIAKTGEYMGFMLYYFDAENIDVKNQREQLDVELYPKLKTIAPDKVVNQYRINERGEIVYLQFNRRDSYGYNETWTYKRGILNEKKKNKEGKDIESLNNYGSYGTFIAPDGRNYPAYSPIYVYSLETPDEATEFPKSDYISTLSQQEAIYRLDSVAMYQTHDVSFQFLVCDDKALDAEKGKLNIGENNLFILNEGRKLESVAIQYTADKIRECSAEVKENMFQDKNLSINISSTASGISREYADKLYVSSLQDKSKKAKQEEIKLIKRFLKLINGVDEELVYDYYDLTYPVEFTPNSESVIFENAKILINEIGVSPETENKIKSKLLTSIFFADIPDDEKEQILQDEKNYIDTDSEQDFSEG